jgi:hypothetical protein
MRVGLSLLSLAVAWGLGCGGRTALRVELEHDESGGKVGSARGGSWSVAGRANSSGGRASVSGAGGASPGGAGAADVGGATVVDCDDALTGDLLDPERVYLLGTFSESACGRGALATLTCPNVAVTGFDCHFDSRRAQIEPNGRLIYVSTSDERLREFHCDRCPVTRYISSEYPRSPLDNDPLLTGPCSSELDSVDFLVSPEGGVMYHCGESTWREIGGARSYEPRPSDELVHLGYGHLALTQKRVVNLDTGVGAEIKGLPADGKVRSVRALPDNSFSIALSRHAKTPGEEPLELWQVDALGNASELGPFPALPPNIGIRGINTQLDASGALFTIAGSSDDVIVRRTITGESRVVYSNNDNPLVKIAASGLITGP